jgi:hypothetical protein
MHPFLLHLQITDGHEKEIDRTASQLRQGHALRGRVSIAGNYRCLDVMCGLFPGLQPYYPTSSYKSVVKDAELCIISIGGCSRRKLICVGESPLSNSKQGAFVMVRKLILAAAATAVVASLLPAPAGANPYRVVRWHGSNFCQVWNYGVSTPWGWYDIVSYPKATFNDALQTQQRFWHKGLCINA